VEENTKTICLKKNVPEDSGCNPLEDISTYQVGGRTYTVEPCFKKSGAETIGTIIMKLIKSDSVKA